MAQLIIRNLENDVKKRLQRRAKQHGRSMEEEARDILRAATKDAPSSSGGLGSSIAELFAAIGLDSEIAELRGDEINVPTFSE